VFLTWLSVKLAMTRKRVASITHTILQANMTRKRVTGGVECCGETVLMDII